MYGTYVSFEVNLYHTNKPDLDPPQNGKDPHHWGSSLRNYLVASLGATHILEDDDGDPKVDEELGHKNHKLDALEHEDGVELVPVQKAPGRLQNKIW